MSARRVVVVGGGITGLSVAYRLLASKKDEPMAVTLLEERARLGGIIQTERHGGLVVDCGPDSFVAAKPHATTLCKEIGLGDRLIGTTERNRRVYVPRGGALHPMPEGIMLTVPTRLLPLARSPLFSWRGKARMALDLVLPKSAPREDESIGSFVRRRLGREALSVLGEPLLGGIYMGDVEALSIRSTFPQLVALEDKHGSLIRGAVAQRKSQARPQGAAPSPFHSLLGGMGELIERLTERVERAGCDIRLGASLRAVEQVTDVKEDRASAPYRVRFKNRDGAEEVLLADDVVLAIPAYAAARAVEGLDAAIARLLRATPYVSTAAVVLAFARSDVPHALDAVGLVIPRDERRRVLAATFISSKWVARAPDDVALMRVFMGGHRDPGALSQGDDALVALAREELAGLIGVRAAPLLARVFRYEHANAQPVVGHRGRLHELRSLASRHPGLHFAGAAFDGVGIPDCVRQANEVAAAIAAR